MPQKILATPAKPRNRTIAILGDSITFNYNYGVLPHQMWPELLAAKLRATVPAANVKARAYGLAGDTTQAIATPSAPGFLGRLFQLTQWETPEIAIIYTLSNDSNANTPTITAAQTTANLNAMVATLAAAGVTRVMILQAHFMNWTAGAGKDSIAAGVITQGSFSDSRARCAAVSPQGGVTPVLVDLMTAFGQHITAGTYTYNGVVYTITAAADFAPSLGGYFNHHVADQNVHLNHIGEQWIADEVYRVINLQPGWAAALV